MLKELMVTRKDNESYINYVKRATHALEDGLITLEDWGVAVLGDNIYSEENTRRCAKFFMQFVDNLDNDIVQEDDRSIEREIEELKAERIKLQTANLEYNANARADAREDMFNERIIEAIKRLAPVDVKHIVHNYEPNGKTGLLCISDLHAGSTYTIKGLYNEVVNAYSFEIMEDRLWSLIGQIENDDVEYDNLVVGILGDCLEGVLRPTSLVKLREPVVDTVIRVSEFLCQWIGELERRLNVPVRVVTVGGNHDEASYPMSKNRNPEENLTKIIVKFMQERFRSCKEITVDDYTDVAIVNIQGVNVMFEHGVDADIKETMEFYSNLYNVDVEEIYTGHLHRPESKAVGITELGDRMVYRVGSICGSDSYSKKLRKAARPSAYFALYENDQGHTWSKIYYL